MAKKLKPMHPGEVLREEFLVPLKMSAGTLAKACGLPRTRIERITSEQTGVTADTALRLAKAQCLPSRVMPADIADMVLFLASDAAAKCTAQDFTVDGGWV